MRIQYHDDQERTSEEELMPWFTDQPHEFVVKPTESVIMKTSGVQDDDVNSTLDFSDAKKIRLNTTVQFVINTFLLAVFWHNT